MKRVKESHERIDVDRRQLSLISNRYQQLVDNISRLEAAIEWKKNEYEHVLGILPRVPTPPGKFWKVLEFYWKIFRTWKILENNLGTGKSWKTICKVLEIL